METEMLSRGHIQGQWPARRATLVAGVPAWPAAEPSTERPVSPLREVALAWQSLGCPPGLLWRGEALAQAQRWASCHPSEVGEAEGDFLQECRQVEHSVQRDARLHGWLRGAVTIAVTAALLAACAWYSARNEGAALATAKVEAEAQLGRVGAAVDKLEALAAGLADEQAATAERLGEMQLALRRERALRLAAQSQAAPDGELALLLAVQAVRHLGASQRSSSGDMAGEIRAALARVLSHPTEEGAIPTQMGAGWLSRDGRLLCALEGVGLGLWDAATGELLLALDGSDHVACAAWSPEAGWVAVATREDTGSSACEVGVWSGESGALLWQGRWPEAVANLGWNADGSRLSIALVSSSVVQLDTATWADLGDDAESADELASDEQRVDVI